MSITKSYIEESILKEFEERSDGYNYKKLLSLLTELNSVYLQEYAYSASMLIRAILDHIPPLLGYKTFNEVVSNYGWSETEKKFMNRLLDFRNEGDSALHKVISNKPDYIAIEDLPPSNRINTLLQECLTNSVEFEKSKQLIEEPKPAKAPKLQAKLLNGFIQWANFAIHGGIIWSSFKVEIEIDNFNSSQPDFISVSIEATVEGNLWNGNYFLFHPTKKDEWKPQQAYPIKGKDVKQVEVFIADTNPVSSSFSHKMPNIEPDTLKLIIKTRSGQVQIIPIKSEQIIKS